MSENFLSKILHLIRYGKLSSAWSWLSIAIIKVGGPKVAAYLSYLSIDWGDMKYDKTILCLYRESFVKDVVELRKRTSLNFPVVKGGFTRFQMAWFPKHMQVQTFYQSYQGENNPAIELGLKYAHHLIHLVCKKKQVHAVLSANFDYWQDSVFKNACKDLDIPFLVLSREHPIIPKVCDFVINRYRKANYHFEGTAIAVAGISTKKVILDVKTICSPEQVTITGLPRYDAWFDVDTSLTIDERPLITLLTFTKGYYADQTFKDVLKLFCETAANYGDSSVHFLIKTKDAADTQYVRQMMFESGLDNLECSHERDLFEVLPKSRMVISYNSLSLVEAVMAKAWIVIPAWDQCKDKGEEAMYSTNNPKVDKVVSFAYNPEELQDMIASCVKGRSRLIQDDDVQDFIGEYIHIPTKDRYSQEFESFVAPYLKVKD